MLSTRLLRRLPKVAPRSTYRPTALFSSAAIRRATQTDLHAAPSATDSFARGDNAYYAEEMYREWKKVSHLLFSAPQARPVWSAGRQNRAGMGKRAGRVADGALAVVRERAGPCRHQESIQMHCSTLHGCSAASNELLSWAP